MSIEVTLLDELPSTFENIHDALEALDEMNSDRDLYIYHFRDRCKSGLSVRIVDTHREGSEMIFCCAAGVLEAFETAQEVQSVGGVEVWKVAEYLAVLS